MRPPPVPPPLALRRRDLPSEAGGSIRLSSAAKAGLAGDRAGDAAIRLGGAGDAAIRLGGAGISSA
eukprot:9464395-Pyramimonas_sp.AAC.1